MTTRLVVFVASIVVLLGIAVVASRGSRGKEGMLVGSGVSSFGNGLAITGEFASVATFLGLVGGVALSGFSGFLPVLGVPLGFLMLLVVVAGPLRTLGRFTLGDMLATKMPSRGLRGAIGLTSLVISLVYMIGQFVGAAGLVSVLFGFDYWVALLTIGGSTLVLVLLGGMSSATAVQMTKTILLLAASIAILLLVLAWTRLSPLGLMGEARDRFGPTATAPQHTLSTMGFDTFSATVATIFGISAMPHLLVRLLTVRTADAARRSSLVAIWLMSAYLLMMGLVGYGASLVVGREAVAAASPGGTAATVQLAGVLGGEVFAAVVAGLVFAIIAAVLAGLLVAMMGTISHDLYGEVLGRGAANPQRQVVVARVGAVVLSLVAALLALGARSINLIFVGSFAFGVAASTIFPVVLLSLYWRRFNLAGALWAVGAGLVFSVLLLVFGPVVSGASAIFPFTQPAVFTIPISFAAAWLATIASRRDTASPAVPEVVPILKKGAS